VQLSGGVVLTLKNDLSAATVFLMGLRRLEPSYKDLVLFLSEWLVVARKRKAMLI